MAEFRRTRLALLQVLLLQALLALPQAAGLRVFKERQEMLATLADSPKEGRVYFHSCEMSSNRATCAFAMDSSFSQESTQCAISNLEDKPWWLAILEQPAYITKVTVLNMDHSYRSYKDGLSSMNLIVSDYVCYRYESEVAFVKQSFPCDAIGDQIIIQSNMDGAVMAICDVEVHGAPLKFPTVLGDNVVLTRSECDQSSVSGSADCSKFADDDSSTCAATVAEESPWMEIALATPSIVNQIRLVNGKSCCPDGLNEISIKLNSRVCEEYSGASFDERTFSCKYFGYKVRVESTQAIAMSICELQVLGHEAAMHSPAKFKSLGCYKDSSENRDLTQLVSSTYMTHSKCYRICKRMGLKYFGLQAGRHCFCGSSYGKHGKAEDDAKTCGVSCAGEMADVCGGALANSMFEIV